MKCWVESQPVDRPPVNWPHRLGDPALLRQVVIGGLRSVLRPFSYEPTVLAGITPSMRIAPEEMFGPAVPLIPFSTDKDAIEYGIAADLRGRDISRLRRMKEAFEFSFVGVDFGVVSTGIAPPGGVKQTGLGREGGRAGIGELVKSQYVCLGEIAG
ncbi:MAG: aldehyde dehydrogenase family protein [Beijerinckiaceae bacterium]|nr:aldehyde dehydrogenase family protein [Beijerinckiaceae bacterium]